MKKTSAAIMIYALISLLFVGVLVVEVVKANPYGMARLFWKDIIVVQSPQNKTYNVETLPINFTVECLDENQPPTRYTLSKREVDEWATVFSKIINTDSDWIVGTSQNRSETFVAHYNSLFSNLADSTYELTVKRYSENPIKVVSSATVYFTIDTTLVDTAIIPEFPSWTIFPLILIATLFAVAIKKKLSRPSS
ncbi:MAG: hypothetical protein JSW14_04515 [Candidatus Bathyarchaeum sp.]|nr:MAG: hypothetical protein JSW14_04515 [Candidatus Bathyarchaeum sp.]